MINKKQATKNNQNNQPSSAKLWQDVSEKEQNAIKGGWPIIKWPYSASFLDGSN